MQLLMEIWLSESPSARKVWIEICIESSAVFIFVQSPSARKVWIEIIGVIDGFGWEKGHLPQGRCGLKFPSRKGRAGRLWSPSARKVWIEIVWERL